jgi:hypothetical protein
MTCEQSSFNASDLNVADSGPSAFAWIVVRAV